MNNRRNAIKTLGLGALGMAVVTTPSLSRAKQQMNLAKVGSAFSTDAEIKPLNFAPDQLDGISKKVILSHWKNNYAGSVRALNTIKARLKSALEDDGFPAFVYNDLKREHLMRTGSVILHEFYFDNMAAPNNRNREFDRVLATSFGSAGIWEKEFTRIGAGLGGGSGWVMLAWNQQFGTLENYWMADHQHCPVSASPILVMDMYEHSYHMDYGAAAGRYIAAFMRNINWEVLARRLDTARSQKFP